MVETDFGQCFTISRSKVKGGLVDTFTNTLVNEFLSKEFTPGFAKYLLKSPYLLGKFVLILSEAGMRQNKYIPELSSKSSIIYHYSHFLTATCISQLFYANYFA